MATGKRYYWIKLKDTFMTSDAVDFLMGQKDGANYVVLYQMLCLKTINTGGRLERTIGEVIIPYDVEKIQRDTKWFTIDTVRVALNLYKSLGLIYADDNGTLILADYENLVGSETDWKAQKQAQRAKELPRLQECKRLNANTMMLPTGKTQYVDEKRYGGNGMLVFDLAGGRCEMCGSYDDLCIHHANGYSNDPDDLYVLCKSCHGIAHSPSTPPGWLHHQRGCCGQEGGHVHTDIDIRDKDIKRLDIRDKENNTPPKSPSRGKREFVPPTLEEVEAYCKERNSPVDPKSFYDYFTAGNWYDSKGQKVRSWKQKLITWEKGGNNNAGINQSGLSERDRKSQEVARKYAGRNFYSE